MRKIIVSEFYTIDGFMSDPKDQMDWVIANFSLDIGKYEDSLYDDSDILLLGRVTYKIFESYWPSAGDNPADIEMASKINAIHKIVFSRSLENVTWKNTTLMADIVPEEIIKMKQQPGKNILLVGSANIVQQLTNLGLIDEYHLLIHPVVLGSGKPLFKDINERHKLKLIKTQAFSNSVVLLQYKPEYMNKGLVARASASIKAPAAEVWDAFVNPKIIKQYMFGTNVVSDWKEGSPIVWNGEWEGKKYEDKGVILKLEPQRLIRYSHFSPLSGQQDVPENYHTVTIELSEDGTQTLISLSQDSNSTEETREHSEKTWTMMLADLKKILEK